MTLQDLLANAPEFWQFLSEAPYRYYQERDLVLDLVHWGWPGTIVGVLLAWQGLAFLLSIFQVIPRRGAAVKLLLGVGTLALLVGLATSFLRYASPESWPQRIAPYPETEPQAGVIVLLPAVAGAAAFAAGILASAYLGCFRPAGKAEAGPPRPGKP